MIGRMLVGAWLLINGQCCVSADLDNSNPSPLVDPLTRRSPLEKNFMRFGRSSLISQVLPTFSPNYIDSRTLRANAFDQDQANTDRLQSLLFRIDRGQDNFMRFGRSGNNFMRFGRAKDNFLRFGKAKNNFMRFGREYMRYGRGNDNFLRFGRSSNDRTDDIEEILTKERRDKALIRLGRQRQSEKNDNFIRFGRRIKRSAAWNSYEVDRMGKLSSAEEECNDRNCPDSYNLLSREELEKQLAICPQIYDLNSILAPEFSVLPAFSSITKRKSNNRSDNFLRLG
ncbi:hypothetical protein O3M35_004348 [Rhynocoris fuscipes]|uniref:FMRFamide n=1 Tax=Rhynocoris fuscipes TaxID=488301 RepID=A0AAW1CFP8_9HEMI